MRLGEESSDRALYPSLSRSRTCLIRPSLLGIASVKRWSEPGGFGARACPRSGGAAGTARAALHQLHADAQGHGGFLLASVIPTSGMLLAAGCGG